MNNTRINKFLGFVLIIFWMLFVLSLVLVAEESRVSIRVDPQITQVGRPVNLYCRVPKHPDNRLLRLEIENIKAREESLEGLESPALFGLAVSRIDCSASMAKCILKTPLQTFVASSRIEVRGCE